MFLSFNRRSGFFRIADDSGSRRISSAEFALEFADDSRFMRIARRAVRAAGRLVRIDGESHR